MVRNNKKKINGSWTTMANISYIWWFAVTHNPPRIFCHFFVVIIFFDIFFWHFLRPECIRENAISRYCCALKKNQILHAASALFQLKTWQYFPLHASRQSSKVVMSLSPLSPTFFFREGQNLAANIFWVLLLSGWRARGGEIGVVVGWRWWVAWQFTSLWTIHASRLSLSPIFLKTQIIYPSRIKYCQFFT